MTSPIVRTIAVGLLICLMAPLALPARDGQAKLLAKANDGDPSAQFRLGWYFQNGIDVDIDLRQAADWYAKAAEQGNNDARNNLGLLYLDGFEGQSRDYVKAAALFGEAISRGHVQAHYNMALLYRSGRGVGLDLSESTRLFGEAARRGSVPGQVAFAKALSQGIGTRKDLVKACMWAIIASDALDESGQALRLTLENQLSAQQIIEAERRANTLKLQFSH